jgi:putative transposase
MRMTPEEFHIWSQRLQLAKETEALIAAIRSSPPVRRVSGRANNITGRYPSPKMGVSIQFESDGKFTERLTDFERKGGNLH